MNLSTATAFVAIITSNISTAVVMAGKAGKHVVVSKAKASKGKTVKAHPSLSYSNSMSYGPTPCPCWAQSDLETVLAENIDSDSPPSCEPNGAINLFREPAGSEQFSSGFAAGFDGGIDSNEGLPFCSTINDGLPSYNSKITKEEAQICFNQIQNRCIELGLLPDASV